MTERIPFNRIALAGRENQYVAEAIAGGYLAGDGPFSRRCERLLEELVGTRRALMTPSCTHALEMAAILLDIKPGDEVVVPAFTFVSTVNAFVLRGARPVFADVREDTLNLDEGGLADLISERTRAVVPVHYAGVACNMDAIGEVARAAGVAIVEDNAHGLLGAYRGLPLGSLGDLATLSFHETKNFTCGEGGSLLVNREDLVERAEIVREKGTDRSRFFRGQVDKYRWVDIGSSELMSELQAAFLLAQLEARDAIQAQRAELWYRYRQELAEWAPAVGARLPTVPEDCTPAHHLFHLLMPTSESRDRFIAHLAERDVQAVFHYLPLNDSPMGERLGGRPGDCPVAEEMSARLVRLPFFRGLAGEPQARVIEAVLVFDR